MLRRPLHWMILAGVLLLAPLAAACGSPAQAAPAPTALPSPTAMPSPTAVPQPAPTATPTPERVTIDEIGLSVVVPGGWQKLDGQWAWSPAGAPSQRLGVAWGELAFGQEPEALLLPKNPVMDGRTEGPKVSWGQAATYKMHVMVEGGQGKVQAEEAHVLVRDGSHLYDIYASGATEQELTDLQPLLKEMMVTATMAR